MSCALRPPLCPPQRREPRCLLPHRHRDWCSMGSPRHSCTRAAHSCRLCPHRHRDWCSMGSPRQTCTRAAHSCRSSAHIGTGTGAYCRCHIGTGTDAQWAPPAATPVPLRPSARLPHLLSGSGLSGIRLCGNGLSGNGPGGAAQTDGIAPPAVAERRRTGVGRCEYSEYPYREYPLRRGGVGGRRCRPQQQLSTAVPPSTPRRL